MKKTNDAISTIIELIHSLHKDTKDYTLFTDVKKTLDTISRDSIQGRESIVTSPLPLDEQTLHAMQEKIQHVTGSALPVRNLVNKTLIGGFTIRIGDKLIDASIKNELEKMKRMFLA